MRTKTLLLVTTFFFTVIISDAQINAGRYLLGGSFSTVTATYPQPYTTSKYKSINTDIQFGKVVKENSVVGVILSYGYNNSYYSHTRDSSIFKNKQYGAGIFYRKYKKLATNLYLFGETDALYAHSESRQNYYVPGYSDYKTFSDGAVVSFVPGISYAIRKRIQVELSMPNIISLSYTHIHTKFYNDFNPVIPDQKGNDFSLNTNINANNLFSFGIGFKFVLGK